MASNTLWWYVPDLILLPARAETLPPHVSSSSHATPLCARVLPDALLRAEAHAFPRLFHHLAPTLAPALGESAVHRGGGVRHGRHEKWERDGHHSGSHVAETEYYSTEDHRSLAHNSSNDNSQLHAHAHHVHAHHSAYNTKDIFHSSHRSDDHVHHSSTGGGDDHAPADGWHKIYHRGNPREDADALVVFRRRAEEAGKKGVFEYRAFGAAPYSVETFFDVLFDLEYHKQWDRSCVALKVLQPLSQHSDMVYWKVAYPWPLQPRDYVYVRKVRRVDEDERGRPVWVHATRAVERAEAGRWVKEQGDAIRVGRSQSMYVVRPRGPNVTEFMYTVLDDPQGNIPSGLVNKFVSWGIVGLLRSMYKACENLQMNPTRRIKNAESR